MKNTKEANNRPIPGSTATPPVMPPHKPSIISAIKKFFSRHPELKPNIDPDEYDIYRETSIGKK